MFTSYHVGAYKSQLKRQNILLIEELMTNYDCLSFSVRESLRFADISKELAAIGKSGTVFDLQIASIALAHGMTIVTSDADFKDVPNLLVEDWTFPA